MVRLILKKMVLNRFSPPTNFLHHFQTIFMFVFTDNNARRAVITGKRKMESSFRKPFNEVLKNSISSVEINQ